MSSKPSTKVNPDSNSMPARKRPAKPAAANIGITPVMKARPIVDVCDCGEGDEIVWLKPVPIHVFFEEAQALKQAKYHPTPDGYGICIHCDAQSTVGVNYFQRYRNGKNNHATLRSFEFCFDCHMVTEVVMRPSVTEIQPENSELVEA